jgi:hypothetical protein
MAVRNGDGHVVAAGQQGPGLLFGLGGGDAASRTYGSHATVMTTLPRACPCSTWRRPSAVSARG